MTATRPAPTDTAVDLDTLANLQRRILWLAVRIIDHANRERATPDGLKVGGHQASSASMVSLMTTLWFAHLEAEDRVAVKPHASPVLHAINYLLGHLDRQDLTTLRAFGGLQAYPSITKDPFEVDFSTGSVGHGAVAPLFAAVTRRYVEEHFGERAPARYVALLGDAELDEGNVWEAIADPICQGGLGNVLWIVDLNRQSLDRVVPGVKAARLKRMFADNDWQVLEAKYGQRLTAVMEADGGGALRAWIDDMPNERYQRSLPMRGGELREFFLDGADPAVRRALEDVPDDELHTVVHDLGGHDLELLLETYREADADPDRPAVVFAYTIKGWGLPIAGDPLNHAALLNEEQIDDLRTELADPDDEWAGFPPDSDEGELIAAATERLERPPHRPQPLDIEVPRAVGLRPTRPSSTQASLGRLVARLGREQPLGERIVTASPDVAVSTGLGGWINSTGVFHHSRTSEADEDSLLRWREHPGGQHIELGISEMNLFSLLGQLGDAERLHDERLLPIGTLYDPFVCRGLDALIHSLYSASRFVFAGTPSGVTLSPEGGAHQSSITASMGLELPNVISAEPAYVGALDWLLCDALDSLANDATGPAFYLRLTTREIDQTPFEDVAERVGEDQLRADVLAGAYRLVEPSVGGPRMAICASGAVMPEAIAAASELADEGVAATVVDITSADQLYRDWRASLTRSIRTARRPGRSHHLARILGPRPGPIVTAHDASPHALAFLGAAVGTPVVPLGVDVFGQSGTIPDLYEANDLSAGLIVNAALAALDLA
ncbi:MAG: 1-deoxy-D-xylulose-5-phosphate synthase N-terminal domain-containing protein [Nitriliruptorales bacterium]|nr:1-deoxy-D-xylulose-5-phosphate synthase N-terminal domain-containing protein [Nitriliruptorales bacterium]